MVILFSYLPCYYHFFLISYYLLSSNANFDDLKAICHQILAPLQVELNRKIYEIGNSIVFLVAGIIPRLEKEKEKYLFLQFQVIQASIRKFISTYHFKMLQKSCSVVQRRVLTRKCVDQKTKMIYLKGVVTVQAIIRRSLVLLQTHESRDYCSFLQHLIRFKFLLSTVILKKILYLQPIILMSHRVNYLQSFKYSIIYFQSLARQVCSRMDLMVIKAESKSIDCLQLKNLDLQTKCMNLLHTNQQLVDCMHLYKSLQEPLLKLMKQSNATICLKITQYFKDYYLHRSQESQVPFNLMSEMLPVYRDPYIDRLESALCDSAVDLSIQNENTKEQLFFIESITWHLFKNTFSLLNLFFKKIIRVVGLRLEFKMTVKFFCTFANH